MMPLTMANPGECYTIRKVGGKEETRRFLAVSYTHLRGGASADGVFERSKGAGGFKEHAAGNQQTGGEILSVSYTHLVVSAGCLEASYKRFDVVCRDVL